MSRDVEIPRLFFISEHNVLCHLNDVSSFDFVDFRKLRDEL